MLHPVSVVKEVKRPHSLKPPVLLQFRAGNVDLPAKQPAYIRRRNGRERQRVQGNAVRDRWERTGVARRSAAASPVDELLLQADSEPDEKT